MLHLKRAVITLLHSTSKLASPAKRGLKNHRRFFGFGGLGSLGSLGSLGFRVLGVWGLGC